MESENSKWFLVYTKTREEKRAKKNLENQGFETFLPMVVYEDKNQPTSIILEAMFPRYLFIKINEKKDNWTQIKSTRGVSHLVIFGQQLAQVPNELIKFLKKRADNNDIIRQKITTHEFVKGDKLVIKKGILQGKEATFISKKSKKRVQILLRLVSQLITAEIPASDIGQKKIREVLQP